MMPTWLPVKLIASMPRSASAMVTSAIDTRSPVVSSMSSSRPGCDLRHAVGERDEVVGGLAHRADDHHDLVATASGEGDVLGDGTHAVGVGDGCAAVLLDDQGHGLDRLPSRLSHRRALTSPIVLGRFLDDSFAPEVRTDITALTVSRLAANSCYRYSAPFLATIARGLDVSLDQIGVALAIAELGGLLSPLTARLVDRLGAAHLDGGRPAGDGTGHVARSRQPGRGHVRRGAGGAEPEQDRVRHRARVVDRRRTCRTSGAAWWSASPRPRGRWVCWSASALMGLRHRGHQLARARTSSPQPAC